MKMKKMKKKKKGLESKVNVLNTGLVSIAAAVQRTIIIAAKAREL